MAAVEQLRARIHGGKSIECELPRHLLRRNEHRECDAIFEVQPLREVECSQQAHARQAAIQHVRDHMAVRRQGKSGAQGEHSGIQVHTGVTDHHAQLMHGRTEHTNVEFSKKQEK